TTRSVASGQTVAYARFGKDQRRRAGVGLDLLANLADVHPDELRVRDRAAPAGGQELLVTDDLPRVAGKACKQFVLLARQLRLLPLHLDASGIEVDLETAAGVTTDRLAGLLNLPQRRAQPRLQLTHVKRLDQVVVGAEIEGGDAFLRLMPGGQDDDWGCGPLAHLPDDVLAVAVGEAEVEQDRIDRTMANDPKRSLGRLGGHDFRAGAGKRGLEDPEDRRLVVDDENSGCVDAHSVSATGWAIGRRMTIRVPRPFFTGLSSPMRPSNASTSPRATERPNPTPARRALSARPRKNLSNTLGSSLAGTPGPESVTERIASRPSTATPATMSESGGLNEAAFSMTFTSTCSSRIGSARTAAPSASKRRRILRPFRRRRIRSSAAAIASSGSTKVRFRSRAPDSSRVMSSRLDT